MVSSAFDAFLRIEDAQGKQLAADDDSGGNLNARLIFTPPSTAKFRIIVTTFPPGQTGPYALAIQELAGEK